jgi:hypothetical protein
MTIACTRCGATQEGEIILPNIAFKFPHKGGCGHGLGPLSVLPVNVKAEKTKVFANDIKVEAPKRVEKKSRFSKKD